MITIQYSNSDSGLRNCFDFSYFLKEYIPQKYFEIEDNEVGAELYYFIDLLKKNDMFDGKKEHCYQLIWSSHFSCIYNKNIPFTMDYDEDYDTVSFSVREKYINFTEEIAEEIKSLIETTKQQKF
ncbi:MAG: hypothetical protein RR540_07065 [Oscillospiraceae bacterium]